LPILGISDTFHLAFSILLDFACFSTNTQLNIYQLSPWANAIQAHHPTRGRNAKNA
jgi:hypothetical protein